MQDEPTDSSAESPKTGANAFRQHFERIVTCAKQNGMDRDTAEALIGIDASAFALRRRIYKGEFSRRILGALDIGIEQTEFEALTAFSRLAYGIGGNIKRDITIGDIAEELSIDPSRASRIVAALVKKGFARRAAAQDDGRKSVLVLTEASHMLFKAFRELKWRVAIEAFSEWDHADIVAFETLFSHYIATMSQAADNAGTDHKVAEEFSGKIKAATLEELATRAE